MSCSDPSRDGILRVDEAARLLPLSSLAPLLLPRWTQEIQFEVLESWNPTAIKGCMSSLPGVVTDSG
jgi:hypothetical protein